MSAVNPLQTNAQSEAGSADKRVYEPSMEEILASIRRIIADDQSLPGRASAPAPEFERRPDIAPPAATRAVEPAPEAFHEAEPSVEAIPVAPPEPSRVEPGPAEVTATLPLPSAAVESPQRVEPDLAPAAPPVEPPRVLHESVRPEPDAVASPAEVSPAHGVIAAPQFAMPDGPANDDAHRGPVASMAFEEPPAVETPEAENETEDLAAYETPIEPPAPAPVPPVGHADAGAGLFSAATDTAVSSAFNMLAASRLADNSDELMTLAREMIRPLLRSWIDDNLPSMVERMVRAEIERVARGGR